MNATQILRKYSKQYGIDRDDIDKARNEGVLSRNEGGHYKEEEVIEWLKDRGNDIKPLPKKKFDAAGLADPDFLKKVSKFNLPVDILTNIEMLQKYYKSQTLMAADQEKAMKLMKEAGRLVDIRETEAEFNDFLFSMISFTKTLPDQLGDAIAKKAAVDKKKVIAVLEIVRDQYIDKYRSLQEEIAERAERIITSKTADAKRRENKK